MSTPGATHRRPLLKAAAGGTLAIGAVGLGVRMLPEHDGPGADGQATLSLGDQGGSGVQALDVALGDDLLPAVSGNEWRSQRLPTTTHSMVGVTWASDAVAPAIDIKSRIDGTWSEWRRLPQLHDRPDPGSVEDSATTGTDLVWIGDSAGIQVRVTGARPRELTLVLLHPDRSLLDSSLDRRTTTPVPGDFNPDHVVPPPTLLSRGTWGADESWRSGSPRYNDVLRQLHVHHTVSTNTYAREDVPGLIRGMYRYHTHNLGWSDIAYNFLVDRFGRTWVGRYGGAAKLVRGAHTLGFNNTSTGVSVIGNFELVTPSSEVLDAIAALAAWKLDLYSLRPRGTANVVSEGSDKFSAGRTATLPVIDGHRDTNDTACPGQHLYDELPTIRTRTAALMTSYHQAAAAITVTTPATLTGTPALDAVLTLDPGVFTPDDVVVGIRWTRDDVVIRGQSATTYTCTAEDVGHRLGVVVTLRRPGVAPVVQTLAADGVVTAPTTLTTTTIGRKGRAIVRVAVTAPAGVTAPVTGMVTVTVHRRSQTVPIVDGYATARSGRAKHYSPGTYPVVVSYSGSDLFEEATDDATVTVR